MNIQFILIGVLLVALIFPRMVNATPLDNLYKKYSGIAGVDWRILKAIAWVETREGVYMVNPNEGGGRISLGLMQILYPDTLDGLNRLYGFSYTQGDLFDNEISVKLASYLIKDIQTRWLNIEDIVASYNAGSPRIRNGEYINQDYVDKVMNKYYKLGGK